MSLARLLRFLFGVLAAGVVLVLVLPFLGVPRSHFLPPPWVYGTAQGKARGVVTNKFHHEGSDPFHVGQQLYFVDYKFAAKAPQTLGVATPGKVQGYTGEVRLDQSTYDGVQNGQAVPIKYETTYPYINGVDAPQAGRSDTAGSNILSGWLLWVVAAFLLGYVFMMLFERFGNKEDI